MPFHSFDHWQEYTKAFARVEDGAVYYSDDAMSAMLSRQSQIATSRKPWTSSRKDEASLTPTITRPMLPPAASKTAVERPNVSPREASTISLATKSLDDELYSNGAKPVVKLPFAHNWLYLSTALASSPPWRHPSPEQVQEDELKDLEQDWVFSATVQPPSVTCSSQRRLQELTYHDVQNPSKTSILLTPKSPVDDAYHDLDDHNSNWPTLIMIADLPVVSYPSEHQSLSPTPRPQRRFHVAGDIFAASEREELERVETKKRAKDEETNIPRTKCTLDELIADAANQAKRQKLRHQTTADVREDQLFAGSPQHYETKQLPGDKARAVQDHQPASFQSRHAITVSQHGSGTSAYTRSGKAPTRQVSGGSRFHPYANNPPRERLERTALSWQDNVEHCARRGKHSNPVAVNFDALYQAKPCRDHMFEMMSGTAKVSERKYFRCGICGDSFCQRCFE